MATRASIQRALTHHEIRGAVTFVRAPSPEDPKWSVRLSGESSWHLLLTDDQALTLCEMLAYNERRAS